MTDAIIRRASQSEFATAINWAAAEGWNPGLDDLAAFYQADSAGFFMGWKDDRPVSCISVVRYGQTHGFLGIYIVHPDWRGTGIGIATWNTGMEHLKGRTIGLYGVLDQQQNYAQSGFVQVGTDTRFTGVPGRHDLAAGHPDIRPLVPEDEIRVLNYHKPFFPADRDAFIANWVCLSGSEENPVSRQSLAACDGDKLIGIGTIRECRNGYKIGPLFADNVDAATALFQSLCNMTPDDAEISLDVPEDNPAAVELAQHFMLEPIFQTARMWKGGRPSHQTRRIFGLTTFELG